MSDTHFHLLVNHFPTVGVLIGFLILLAGFILKKQQVKNTALVIFIFSAMVSLITFFTREGSEEIVENMPNISETLIHKHEEQAERFFGIILILGASSLITMFMDFINLAMVKYCYIFLLLLSIAAIVISKNMHTKGGEITHIEIRKETNVINLKENGDHVDD